MMPKWFLAVIAATLCLTGCAQQVWYKPGVTQAQAQRDLAEVKYEAIKSTPPYRGVESPVAAGIGDGMHQVDVINAGMEAKGYRKVNKSEVPSEP